jgi:hypothetical protein
MYDTRTQNDAERAHEFATAFNAVNAVSGPAAMTDDDAQDFIAAGFRYAPPGVKLVALTPEVVAAIDKAAAHMRFYLTATGQKPALLLEDLIRDAQ